MSNKTTIHGKDRIEGEAAVRARHDKTRKRNDDGNDRADERGIASEAPDGSSSGSSWKYHTGEAFTAPRALIKGILPETGVVLLSGQWGTFKTSVAMDVSVCVMTALPFADKYSIKRRGGVLYFALEGEGRLSARLSAIAAHRGVTGPLPFAWRGDCPALTDKNAAALCDVANEAVINLRRKFGLPVSLIFIDTVITAARYDEGGDNDTAASQKMMSALRILSQRSGALVVGIDHFGKVVETGTRGSSAKEGAADVVIALLADRELSGAVKNTRVAMRKQRDGLSGFEIPFTVRLVETGTDDDGDSVTAPIIDWQTAQQPAPQRDGRWTPSMQLLRRVLMTALADGGKNVRPFADGPTVRACDIELVRREFYRQYPADGNDKQKSESRRKAFNRAVKETTARSLVASREVDGVQLVWLTRPEGTNA